MKRAEIKIHATTAGWLSLDENGYHFVYESAFLNSSSAEAVSLTLPLQKEIFNSKVLFPFFDGLIPEGWLLDIAERNWKLNPKTFRRHSKTLYDRKSERHLGTEQCPN